MSTDEEYLDNLLKSMEENPVAQRTDFPSVFQEEEPLKEKMVIKDIEPEPEELTIDEKEPESVETEVEKEPESIEVEVEKEPDISEEEAWKESLDELLAGAEDDSTEKESDEIPDEFSNEFEGLDVTELIDHLDGTDADLNEINDLLKKTDNNEAIDPSSFEDASSDEDMLELLGSVKEEPDTSGEEDLTKKNKKSFSLPFWKKKKSKDNAEESENNLPNSEEDKEDVGRKEKGKGFWHRLMEELTREEEEPEAQVPADENEEILIELEAEDLIKEKKKSKKEKKKRDKKGKKKKDASADGENEDSVGEETGKKKKKKPKREKKAKPEGPKEKSPKILSRRKLFALIAFCATLIAAIVLLSIFLPDYADKKNARTAFYIGDYSKVYELLYDKDLNPSDRLIFERANAVLKLQRRLDSYNLNKKIGQEAEALDALLQGIMKYEELLAGKTYGAEEELQALYQQILEHLNQDYGISEEEARKINSYDSETYSRKILSVVNGEDFSMPGMEDDGEGKDVDAAKLQDILPEEEDMMQTEP